MPNGAQSGRHRRGPTIARRRWRRTAVVALLLAGLSSIGLGLGAPEPPLATGVERGDVPTGSTSVVRQAPAAAGSRPIRLDVPTVGIHVDLVELGLAADGTLEVPAEPQRAGWFSGSPAPGQPGPSVIVGHVDSMAGPAVFHRLGELRAGSRVETVLESGQVAEFEITAVRSFPKSRFPTQAVYGDTAASTLRLITCGNWNEETDEYDDNVVVFGELVELS